MFDNKNENQADQIHAKGKNPFINAQREWDDRFMNQAKNSHAWKGFAFFEALIICVLIWGLVKVTSQSRIEPYLAVVDKTTYEVEVMGPAEKVATYDQKVMKKLVEKDARSLIENLRTIIGDKGAQKKIMGDAYAHIAANSAAAKFTNAWFQKRDPFKYAETGTISVDDIYSALPLSESVWQIEWVESERNLAGEVVSTAHYKAIVTYEMSPPETDKEMKKNPIGFYAIDINWSQQRQS